MWDENVSTQAGQGAWVVFAKATSSTVTLTGNTEDASHKDIVGSAAMPEVVSKAWQMQVEALEVLDMNKILQVMRTGEKIEVRFDETSTSDNQTGIKASMARNGHAYITDATFNFNDRENAVKNITIIGTGALIKNQPSEDFYPITPSAAFTKGQFVRLFLGNDNTATPSAVLAFAKQLAFHVSVSLENSTTKDTEGDWIVQEPVGLSYDISTNALVRSGESITSEVSGQTFASIEDIYEASAPVKFEIANVSGANQRTKGSALIGGSVVITSLVLNAPNRQVATYDCQMQGYGNYLLPAT
jgi:hypothetical protein